MLGIQIIAASLASAQPLPAVPVWPHEPAPSISASSAITEIAASDITGAQPRLAALEQPQIATLVKSDPEPQSAAPAEPPVATETATTDPQDFAIDEIKPANDPLEPINRISFKVFWTLDKFVIRPAALLYRTIVPDPLRDAARNAMTNLSEPIVLANDILQLRPKRALRTLARFLIKSTLGLGGLVDAAKRKPFNIPFHYNTFGRTLGYYGVKPGPYLFFPIGAPIIGPTTLRDIADYPQGLLWPGKVGFPFDQGEYDLSTTIVGGLGDRERNDAELKAMFGDAIDKYATFRANFLQNLQGEIDTLKAKDGEVPKGRELDDPLSDPAVEAGVPAAPSP